MSEYDNECEILKEAKMKSIENLNNSELLECYGAVGRLNREIYWMDVEEDLEILFEDLINENEKYGEDLKSKIYKELNDLSNEIYDEVNELLENGRRYREENGGE